MTVFCRDCDAVHPASRDEQKPWQWRCLRHPRASGYGFVHPDYSPQPPYRSCRDVNTEGHCPDFSPLRKPLENSGGA